MCTCGLDNCTECNPGEPDRVRCGYRIQYSDIVLTGHPPVFRLSRDGWSCYQTASEMAELDSLSDGDFEALLGGIRALTAREVGE